MINFSYHFLMASLFIVLKCSSPLPTSIKEKQNQQEESLSQSLIPENNVIEEGSEEPPVFIMVPVLGERPRRGIYEDAMNFDNISYEIPTFIKFNQSSKGDFEVSLVPGPDTKALHAGGGSTVTGNGGPNNNCCPPQPPAQRPNFAMANGGGPPPLCLTIAIDNAFPPGKAGKIVVTNSSDIRGTSVILKINFMESKTTTCASDLFGAFDISSNKERLESQKNKKVEEGDEEEAATTEVIDQKTLQEIILKILTANKTSKTTVPTEELIFLENSTGDPSFSFVFNPSLFHKISGKYATLSTTKRSITYKGLDPPDFDSLLKTVEHITSAMPKEKLLSLLSNLINKAALNKEVSSNQ